MATRNGIVKKTALTEFEKIRKSGIVAINLDRDDILLWADSTSGDDDVLLVTRNGKSIRFSEREVRPTARDTRGVRGITLKESDTVVSMDIISQANINDCFLTVMEKGIGKKTPLSDFPLQRRGGQGVKVAEVKHKTGNVVISQIVPTECTAIILTSTKGQVVKVPVSSVPTLKRATVGVILMRFATAGDTIAAGTCLSEKSLEV